MASKEKHLYVYFTTLIVLVYNLGSSRLWLINFTIRFFLGKYVGIRNTNNPVIRHPDKSWSVIYQRVQITEVELYIFLKENFE